MIFGAALSFFNLVGAAVVHTEVDVTVGSLQNTYTDAYSFDFNQDGSSEFSLTWYKLDVGDQIPVIRLGSVNGNAAFIGNISGAVKYVTELDNGAYIAANASFESNGAYVLQNNSIQTFGVNAERFVGCRFELEGFLHYGWIRLSIDQNSIVHIKDFAYENTPNLGITIDETLSLEYPETVAISMYPNPASDEVIFKSESIIESINIVSLSGKTIETATLDSSMRLSVAHLKSGYYFVQVRDIFGRVSVLKLEKL